MNHFFDPYIVLDGKGGESGRGPSKDGVLGSGGMGRVYAVRDRNTGKEYALKVLHPELADSVEFRSRFETEAKWMADLARGHRNLLEVMDYRSNDTGEVWLLMPLIQGIPALRGGKPLFDACGCPVMWVTLRDRMDAARLDRICLPLEDVRRIIEEVLDAIAHAHGANVLHCDLKPENILLTSEGIRIADFGLAKVLDPARFQIGRSSGGSAEDGGDMEKRGPDPFQSYVGTETELAQSRRGTIAYMAPELKQAPPGRHSVQSDLYAIGLIAWQLLTGTEEIGLGERASDLRKEIGADHDGWLKRSMARSVDERFRNAIEMREEWARLFAPVSRHRKPVPSIAGTGYRPDLKVPLPSGPDWLGLWLRPESADFWIKRELVSQQEWEEIMGEPFGVFLKREDQKFYNYHRDCLSPEYPVFGLNYHESLEFCKAATRRGVEDRQFGNSVEFGLPTKKEWERITEWQKALAWPIPRLLNHFWQWCDDEVNPDTGTLRGGSSETRIENPNARRRFSKGDRRPTHSLRLVLRERVGLSGRVDRDSTSFAQHR